MFLHFFPRGDLRNLCNTMKNKIISRAFYGWLEYYRYTKKIKNNLVNLVEMKISESPQTLPTETDSKVDALLLEYLGQKQKLDETMWHLILATSGKFSRSLFYKIIYENGIESAALRKKVWPYLLEHYTFEMKSEDIDAKYKLSKEKYHKLVAEWKIIEEYIHLKNESEKTPSSAISIQRKKKRDDDSGIYSDTHSDLFSPTESTESSSILSDSTHWSLSPTDLFRKSSDTKSGLGNANIFCISIKITFF